jgi:hypothetical protein
MGIKLWLVVSILAASFTTVATAEDIDWKRVDEFERKPVLAIAIGFQPTGGITGDFVLSGDEVNPVIRRLRANDIDVTAVHNHMLDEQPRLFFHFWADDDALKLARGLRAALDKTASIKN